MVAGTLQKPLAKNRPRNRDTALRGPQRFDAEIYLHRAYWTADTEEQIFRARFFFNAERPSPQAMRNGRLWKLLGVFDVDELVFMVAKGKHRSQWRRELRGAIGAVVCRTLGCEADQIIGYRQAIWQATPMRKVEW